MRVPLQLLVLLLHTRVWMLERALGQIGQAHTGAAAWREAQPGEKQWATRAWQDGGVDVLSSRILLRPADMGRSRHFYRDVLGLAVYREFGSAADPSMVFFLGSGMLEVSGPAAGPAGDLAIIWLQVRDVHAEHERLAAAGVRILREPEEEPWGLIEMWIEDPDGVRIVIVEIPAGHPLRRDPR
jgi:catechol 2,3-dioxygenase-like lactoylglutathione lyase family enzyme